MADPKFAYYRSTTNGEIYAASNNMPGYEDAHPDEYTPVHLPSAKVVEAVIPSGPSIEEILAAQSGRTPALPMVTPVNEPEAPSAEELIAAIQAPASINSITLAPEDTTNAAGALPTGPAPV